MRRSLIAFLLGIRACGLDAQELPPLKVPRVPHHDVQHIALDLRFDLLKRQAHGSATITLAPLTATDSVRLDAGMLTIERVEHEGRSLAFTYDGKDADDGLRIALRERRQAGEVVVLTVHYRTNWLNESDPNNLGGSFGKGLRFFAPTTTEPRKRTQVWSMPELGANRYWFPCYDGLGDPRTVEVTAHVPPPLMVISNGTLVDERAETDGTRTFHWRTDEPHDNYLTFIVMGEYARVDQQADGIALHTYGYPDELEATRASVERLPDMMAFFNEVTGVRYPAPAFTQVVVQDFAWGRSVGTGMQSENMVDDFGTHADFLYLWDGIEAEGLAQQWCGLRIHMKDPGEAWIGRGLARFLSELYSEHRNSRDEMLLWNHAFNQSTYMGDWSSGVRRPISTQHFADEVAVVQDNYAINRASLVFHLLRDELGDAVFGAGLKRFMQERWGKDASTYDLQQAMEHAAGRPLTWFFDQWVRGMGHPVFEVGTAFDAQQGSFALTLRQTQQPDSSAFPQVRWFQGHMDIEVDGELHRMRLVPQEVNTFYLPLPRAPRVVVVDHQSQWIKESVFAKNTAGWLAQFTGTTDVMARQEALGELARIHQDSTTTMDDKRAIIDACHAVIRDRSSYWRVRYNAMAQLRWLISPPFDAETVALLKDVIDQERSWNRALALSVLGTSADAAHAPVFIAHLSDPSDRVVNAAAIALGKSKSPLAFDALIQLKDKPSWKNQSLISTLYALKELGDPRGAAIALAALRDDPPGARWSLATPVWDYRLAAANTLVALGRSNEAWPILETRYAAALRENDVNDIFSNVLLMVSLGDARAKPLFAGLRDRFKDDPNAVAAIGSFEEQLDKATAPK